MRKRPGRARLRNLLLSLGSLVILIIGSAGGYGYWVLAASRPVLDGRIALAGLQAPVKIERDGGGVPQLIGESRIDLMRALGFVHAQERFFQMDLLRRAGAGELGLLLGAAGTGFDDRLRLHRLRAHAQAILSAMPADERASLDSYTAGVNAGLAALGHAPFEYSLLRVTPAAWQPEDSLLTAFAMYLDLQQGGDAMDQRRRSAAQKLLGPSLADFLYPKGTPADAALDGSFLPEPPMPSGRAADGAAPPEPEPPVKGSDNLAIAGTLTATGSAMVGNDMHLGLRVPNTWYRARLTIVDSGQAPALDLTGVTLPGMPFIIAGSNGHIAWGFTNSYIETVDAILLDPVAGEPDQYQTPDGPKKLERITEPVCAAHGACHDLIIEQSIWGPVISRDADGRRIALRWTADDANALMLGGLIGLEQAQSLRAALDAAHRAGMPQQNLLVGDRDGHIAWTIIGQIPRRIGLDDGLPHSWADGTHRWQGYLSADEVPEVIDPAEGRLWTGNNRVLGGAALTLIGDGGYSDGTRAGQLRDDLRAHDRFAERDLLLIQLDDHARLLEPWQILLTQALEQRQATEPRFAQMLPYVRDWGGRAVPRAVGYRLVRMFQQICQQLVYGGLTEGLRAQSAGLAIIPHMNDAPLRRLLNERPAALVPRPFQDWDALIDDALRRLSRAVDQSADGVLDQFTWGAANHAGIHHPLAAAIPGLGWLTDPPDEPIAGDTILPRVVAPGFGASERFIVSPGHEASGIFEMPTGQAGNPLSPYYLAGHEDWVHGRPTPFLPGPARWHLTLTP